MQLRWNGQVHRPNAIKGEVFLVMKLGKGEYTDYLVVETALRF